MSAINSKHRIFNMSDHSDLLKMAGVSFALFGVDMSLLFLYVGLCPQVL